MNLSQKVIDLLTVNDMSQAELARLSGVSKSLVSDIINGRDIVTTDTLIKISSVFKINPSYFFEDNSLEQLAYLSVVGKAKKNNIKPEILNKFIELLIESKS